MQTTIHNPDLDRYHNLSTGPESDETVFNWIEIDGTTFIPERIGRPVLNQAFGTIHCSVCGKILTNDFGIQVAYCHHCGAKVVY